MKKFAFSVIVICALVLVLCGCQEAYSLSFSNDSYTVRSGTSFILDVKIRPKSETYTITSANNTIATVTDNVVTAVKEGVVELTVSSGSKSAKCILYVQDEEINSGDGITLLPSYTVGFEIVNYEEAGLLTGKLESVLAVEGSSLNVSDPFISGYIADCWYTDLACTQKFDMQTRIYADMTLYARLIERDIAFNIVNGYIVGLLYPKLSHEELIFPETEENGGTIYGIADEAFMGDTQIKRAVLPSSYRSVGTSAFAGCTALEEVVIPDDSELHTIGVNAFGVIQDDNGAVTAACSELSVLNLPDTVTRVGNFAFFQCTQLAFDGIPSRLEYVESYAFAGTKMNNVSLANVHTLYEGAFNGCALLDTVTDSEGVTRCDKLVFEGTKLVTDAYKEYNNTKKDDNAAFYADTILFGCYSFFGKSAGSGKLKIKDTTTLIADEAFNNANQSELTVYIDTAIAADALNRDFLGRNVFVSSEGVFVVVGNGLSASYKARYGEGERNYADRFAEAEIIEVRGDNNADQINWGKHILLKKQSNGTSYYYDRFVPFEEGTPRQIKLSELALRFDIVRVNMSAFNGIDNLIMLELNRVQKLACFAVSNCKELKKIDLTKTVSPTELEDRQSLQFTALPADCYVYVKDGDYNSYRSNWSKFITSYSRLKKASEI